VIKDVHHDEWNAVNSVQGSYGETAKRLGLCGVINYVRIF
jgi:hypothetical protein